MRFHVVKMQIESSVKMFLSAPGALRRSFADTNTSPSFLLLAKNVGEVSPHAFWTLAAAQRFRSKHGWGVFVTERIVKKAIIQILQQFQSMAAVVVS